MAAGLVLCWAALSLVVALLHGLSGGLAKRRLEAGTTIALSLAGCVAVAWKGATISPVHWQNGMMFDGLAAIILPAMWTGSGVCLAVRLLLPDPGYDLALTALAVAAATAGLLSGSALLAVALLLAGALLVLTSLLLPAEGDPGTPHRIAAALKYLTLTMLGGGCLLMAALLASFFAINRDRLELPAIIVALLVLGIGLMAGLMPFYFHLPDLFDTAPLLAALAFVGPVQALALGYLARSFAYQPWLLADSYVARVLALGALAGAFLAALLGTGQVSARRSIAFNAMRDAGWVAFGLATLTPTGWFGALTLLAVRCVAQPLILASSTALEFEGKGSAGPASTRRTIAATGLIIAWLATIGAPATAGYWGLRAFFTASTAYGPIGPALLLGAALLAVWQLIQLISPIFGPIFGREGAAWAAAWNSGKDLAAATLWRRADVGRGTVIALSAMYLVAAGLLPGLLGEPLYSALSRFGPFG